MGIDEQELKDNIKYLTMTERGKKTVEKIRADLKGLTTAEANAVLIYVKDILSEISFVQ